VGQTGGMLAHSSEERSGLCEQPTETKQIEKKFLQAGFLRGDFLVTLRCGMNIRHYVQRNIAKSGASLSEILS
jgi:hypothetical protein